MRFPLAFALISALTMTAPAAAQPTASHTAAAVELLELTQVPQTMSASIDIMLNAQFQANPELRRFERIMRDFMVRHLSWDVLRDEYAALYTARFTEAELRTIAAFYRTPAGQKLVGSQTDLMREGAELGVRRMQENQAELQELIMREMSSAN